MFLATTDFHYNRKILGIVVVITIISYIFDYLLLEIIFRKKLEKLNQYPPQKLFSMKNNLF